MLFRILLQLIRFVWASPYSLIGLFLGCIGLFSGGHVRIRGCVIEFYGGFNAWLIRHLPGGEFVFAITLGHTILGQSDASLDISREHELVHVRQYERWGPFMGPAYLFMSFILWIIGKRPYHDNPFEKEAYGKSNNGE